jgi:hypothetical protein
MKAPLESLALRLIVAKLHHFSKPSAACESLIKRPRIGETRVGIDELSQRAKRVIKAPRSVKLERASPGLNKAQGVEGA